MVLTSWFGLQMQGKWVCWHGWFWWASFQHSASTSGCGCYNFGSCNSRRFGSFHRRHRNLIQWGLLKQAIFVQCFDLWMFLTRNVRPYGNKLIPWNKVPSLATKNAIKAKHDKRKLWAIECFEIGQSISWKNTPYHYILPHWEEGGLEFITLLHLIGNVFLKKIPIPLYLMLANN